MTKKKSPPKSYRSPGTRPNTSALSGGGKGGGNMLAQIQQLQQEMEAAQASLADETVEVSVGGGVVSVVASGQQEIRAITIRPEVVDPDDVEMLEDLILSAVNEALKQSQHLASQRMGGLTQGLNLPPGLI